MIFNRALRASSLGHVRKAAKLVLGGFFGSEQPLMADNQGAGQTNTSNTHWP